MFIFKNPRNAVERKWNKRQTNGKISSDSEMENIILLKCPYFPNQFLSNFNGIFTDVETTEILHATIRL